MKIIYMEALTKKNKTQKTNPQNSIQEFKDFWNLTMDLIKNFCSNKNIVCGREKT